MPHIPILGYQTLPQAASAVYFTSWASLGSNKRWAHLVAVWETDSVTRPIRGAFRVPSNFASTPKIRMAWTSPTGGSANVQLLFEYRVVAAGESLDQSGEDESVEIAATGPASAFLFVDSLLTLTGTFNASEMVQFEISRNVANAADVLADSIAAFSIDFDYVD